MNDITLTEALQVMEQLDRQGRPVPFSIEFDTYDQKSNSTSGRIMYDRAELVMPNKSFTRTFTSLTPQEYGQRKNPNHYENMTRNIRIDGEQIRKVHIHCIIKLNNQNVRWHIR